MHTMKNAGYQYSHSVIVLHTLWKWWLWNENCNAERNIFLASSIEILLLTCVKNFRDDATVALTRKKYLERLEKKTIFQRKRKLYCTTYTNERSLFLVNEKRSIANITKDLWKRKKAGEFSFSSYVPWKFAHSLISFLMTLFYVFLLNPSQNLVRDGSKKLMVCLYWS